MPGTEPGYGTEGGSRLGPRITGATEERPNEEEEAAVQLLQGIRLGSRITSTRASWDPESEPEPEPEPPAVDPEPEPAEAPEHAITEMNVRAAQAYIADVTDTKELVLMADVEKLAEKPRVGVLEAITARWGALTGSPATG